MSKVQKTTVATKAEPEVPAAAMAKIYGIVASTPRDLFRQEAHDAIEEYAKTLTLPGVNHGGKFRHAEAELWKEQDHARWEAVAKAASKDNVDWKE